jgi:ABC-type nickel/cobalt efflux system permease component RcnA
MSTGKAARGGTRQAASQETCPVGRSLEFSEEGTMGTASHIVLTGWILGTLLGMRHALEPDHIAAVSTLMTERRHSRGGALLLGACWGFGHSLALLVVGILLAGLHAELPPRLALLFEAAVVVMLVGLGVKALRSAFRGPLSITTHREHGHAHDADHDHVSDRRRFAARSISYGIIHGLAGSGSLTALVIANLPSLGSRVAYNALFGFGSMLGMATLSGLAGLPLSRIRQAGLAMRVVGALTGVFSISLGLFWAAPLVRQLL